MALNKIDKKMIDDSFVQEVENVKNTASDLTVKLAETATKPRKNLTVISERKKAVVTILDDDARKEVYTRLKPILNAKNVPASFAAITGRFDNPAHLTIEEMKELELMGWEIMGHSYSHPTGQSGLMEYAGDYEKLEYEIGSGCKDVLTGLGFDVTGFVYPQGGNNFDIREITKKHYEYAFGFNGINDDSIMDSMRIARIAFGSFTQTNPTINGNSEKSTIAYYKECVDYAIANNAWLVFMTHIAAQDISQDAVLSELIDYIQSKNVAVMTGRDANAIHGNKYFSGDIDKDYFIIDKYNKPAASGGDLSMRTRFIDYSKKNANDLIATYEDNTITYMRTINSYAATHSLPLNISGYLVTFKLAGANSYSKQEYWANTLNEKFIRAVNGDGTWTPWMKENALNIKDRNSYTAANLIATYPSQSVTLFTVNNAGAMGFPNNSAGTVITYKAGGNGYDYQTFKGYLDNTEYVRHVNSDGTWATWKSKNALQNVSISVSDVQIPANGQIDIAVPIAPLLARKSYVNASPAWGVPSGLMYNVMVKADGVATIRVFNPTVTEVPLGSRNWLFTYIIDGEV